MSRRGRLLSVALPELARRSPRSRRRLTAVVVFMLATLLLNLAHTGLGLGGERFDVPLNAWLQNVVVLGAFVLVAARAAVPGPERAGWVALAAAIGCWSLGNLYWNLALYSSQAPPFPSPADVGWLLFYPCAYACIALRLRSAARQLPRSLWLDGLVGLLSVGAVGTVLVVAPVLAAAEGPRAAVLTNAAYPMADLLLFALCVAILPLHGLASRARLVGAGGRLCAVRGGRLGLPGASRRRQLRPGQRAGLRLGRGAGGHEPGCVAGRRRRHATSSWARAA